jgi:magnesium-transporting ATPase (P-type)
MTNLYDDLLKKRSWESIEQEEILSLYEITEEGLPPEEARDRLQYFGENKLPEAKKKSRLLMFLGHFNNALIYVLIVAAVITGFMQHWIDMGVIIGGVIINAIIGFIQEDRAEKALDSIRDMMSVTATVIRGGRKSQLDTEKLVPGDVVFVKAGDKIPADLRIIEASNLRVEEASLTGEAEEVIKTPEVVGEGADLGDRTSMTYMGTSVRNGSGTGIVVATGENTELGNINRLMSEVEETTTPLVKKNQPIWHLPFCVHRGGFFACLPLWLLRQRDPGGRDDACHHRHCRCLYTGRITCSDDHHLGHRCTEDGKEKCHY